MNEKLLESLNEIDKCHSDLFPLIKHIDTLANAAFALGLTDLGKQLSYIANELQKTHDALNNASKKAHGGVFDLTEQGSKNMLGLICALAEQTDGSGQTS